MQNYITKIPRTNGLFIYLIDENPDSWSDECVPAIGREFVCRFTDGKTFIPSTALETILDGYGSDGLGGTTVVVSEAEVVSKKYGEMFFSFGTNKLYDSAEEAIFASYRAILRSQLKEAGVHTSWEWLFLPFLREEWLALKKRSLIAFLKKIAIPLKDHGLRIIPHDSVGYYGPSQIKFMVDLLGPEESPYFDADRLNSLGKNVFYIKPDGGIPSRYSEFYSEFAEIELTRLAAEGRNFETNIPYDREKLEEMKIFFAKAKVSEARHATFGNTGEALLLLHHPDYCDGESMGIRGEVSRSFLKKFCAKYDSSGTSQYVNFSHHFSFKSLPDFKLWKK